MIVDINLETIVSVTAIMSAVNGAVLWFLNSVYVRRAQFYSLRKKDEENLAAAVDKMVSDRSAFIRDVSERFTGLEGKFQELETQHRILAEGPLKSVTATLQLVQSSLYNLNVQSEQRNEKLIDTLNKLDRRITVVETQQTRPH